MGKYRRSYPHLPHIGIFHRRLLGGSVAEIRNSIQNPRLGSTYNWVDSHCIPTNLRIASQAFDNLALGALFGSFTVVMILFIIPVTLLGMASPFAIRLSIDGSKKAGKVSGRIYAISTLGSFIGTFLPVLVLVPTIGTYRTFLVLAALLLIFALIGLFLVGRFRLLLKYSWMAVIILVLFIFGVQGLDKNTDGSGL